MNREEKTASVAALQDRFERAAVALVTIPRGLTVAQVTQLRRTIRAAGGEYKIAKNTLVRLALREGAYKQLEALMDGPTGLVFGYTDPVAVTKALTKFADASNEALAIKGGGFEGHAIGVAEIKALAAMPPIEVLRARIVSMAKAPGARLVSQMRHPGARLAGAVEALVKRKQQEAGADAPAAE